MQILCGLSFDMDDVQAFMQHETQTRGLFRRKNLETALTYPPLLRPFREVLWHLAADDTEFWSLIDEDLFRLSLTIDQQLLLWRPRYTQCEWDEDQKSRISAIKSVPDDSLLQATVDDLIDRRLAAQQELDESEDDIRRVQADRSMIMNCPQGSIVSKGTLCRRLWVPTVMTEFQNLETASSRLVFLESPSAASLKDAVTSGRALTRLCHLNES
ncbi:MAG: hypothetical protein ACXABY_13300, partial [Candidatus Thorarchaeota archaeon]